MTQTPNQTGLPPDHAATETTGESHPTVPTQATQETPQHGTEPVSSALDDASPQITQASQPQIYQPDPSKQQTSQHTQPPKKTWLKPLGLILIIAVLGLIAYGLWQSYQPKQVQVQGRVETETVHVSTKVPSRIEHIYVHDGQQVKKGQALVRLYSPEVETKKQQALGALQSALALQSTAERGSQQENVESLRANWQSLKAQQELAQSTYTRGENLFQQGVISRQRRDEMLTAARSSAQMTESAYQQYQRALRGSTPQQKSSADAQVKIAQAALDEANALAAETELLAPISGTVSKIYGKVSELVATAVPVVSILQDQDIHVSINIREDQYSSVYRSQQLTGFIPALKQTATFNIQHIDAEGEFATIKTTRQTGGYDIRSFKVELRPAQPIAELKVGMSVLFNLPEAP